jgi:hypothetical protein
VNRKTGAPEDDRLWSVAKEGKMSRMMKLLGLPDDARRALEVVAEKYGLTVAMTNAKHRDTGAGFWFEFSIADDGEKEDAQRRAFALKCCCRVTQYQVQAEDYGMILTHKGMRYKLVGVNTDADKYPLATEALDDGPNYRLPMEAFRIAKGTASALDKARYAA